MDTGRLDESAAAGFAALDADGNGYVTSDELVRAYVEFVTSVEDAAGNEILGPVAA